MADICGGVLPGDTKDMMNYKEPLGPKGINSPKSPGIHGTNHGISDGPHSAGPESSGSTSGVTNHGCCGSQGRY
jgi:hypothetical protein